MTNTYKNTLKSVWKKPLVALLSFTILAGMSTTCFANQKDVPILTEKTTKAFNKEDVDSYGWLIASVEAHDFRIDLKELALSYSEEDLNLVRKLTSLCDTKDKRKQLGRIHQKQKANEVLTEEESLIFKDYNLTLAELKKMLKAKKKQINTDLESHWLYNLFELGSEWEEILVLTQEETNVVRKLRKIAKERGEEYAAFNDISEDSIYGEMVRSRIFQDYEAKTLSKPEKIALASYYLKVKKKLKDMGLN